MFSLHSAVPYGNEYKSRTDGRETHGVVNIPIGGNTERKVFRFLFEQHSTPKSETGKCPAETLMGRVPRPAPDELHSDRQRNSDTNFQEIPKFRQGDTVYMRSFGGGPCTRASRVGGTTTLVSYKV